MTDSLDTPPTVRRNPIATASLIFAIVALLIAGIPFNFLLWLDEHGWTGMTTLVWGILFWPTSLVLGIVAIVLAAIGIRNSRERGRKALAITTLILMTVFTAAAIVLVIAVSAFYFGWGISR